MSHSLSIIADQQILFAKEAFSSFGQVKLVDGRSIDKAMLKDADFLLVRSVTKVNKELLQNSNVSFVGSATSGIDHIDTDYLQAANIGFVHAPGSNARSVAEYVLSSLFAAAEFGDFDLSQKTVGIIGCGQVGSRVKRFMETLGIKCLLNDPPLADLSSAASYVDLERIAEADIITLHVPYTTNGKHPSNHLINKDFLDLLKSDVVLINTSRGEVIDELALLEFKESNPAATLILDVWCHEPTIDINLLQQTFIGTPHIAGYSYDGKLKATKVLAEALQIESNNKFSANALIASDAMANYVEYDDNTVQLAVMRAYDVRSDAIALKELVDMACDSRGSYFDSLRKNYPTRREFTHWCINSKMMSHDLNQQLLDLGFKTEAA